MQNQENLEIKKANTDNKFNNESNNESYDNFENDSDDETYININDILKAQLKNIYQIQINNESLIIKHIGLGSHIPDMIIKEGFGKNNNLSMYNCVYMDSELDFLKTEVNNNKLLPIVKLVEKIDTDIKIYSLSVKINSLVNFNEPITNFNIYLTYPLSTDYISKIELEKNINSSTIIEKMLENVIRLGLEIL